MLLEGPVDTKLLLLPGPGGGAGELVGLLRLKRGGSLTVRS